MKTPHPWALPRQPATRAQLLASGVTRAMLATHLRSGRLLRLRNGVYLDADSWPVDPAARHLLLAHAELEAQPQAVLSHATAAVVWGLPSPGALPWHSHPPATTQASPAGRRSSDAAARHRSTRLPPHHVARDPDGYPVTTLARTAIDLSRNQPLPAALVLLDAGARRIIETLVPSARRADYANPRFVNGARQALLEIARLTPAATLPAAIDLTEPCRESAIESLSAGHLHLSGLPIPEFQPAVRTPLGTLYPDCLWREAGLVGEVDGAVKYDDREAFVREKEREQVLRDLGFRVVRWLGKEILLRPDVVLDRIARALGA